MFTGYFMLGGCGILLMIVDWVWVFFFRSMDLFPNITPLIFTVYTDVL